MPKLSLSQAWDEARAILAHDGRLFGAVALALVVLPQTIIGLVAPMSAGGGEPTPLIWALLAITILFGIATQISLNRLAIGPSTTVASAIGRGFARTPALLGAFVILLLGLFVVLIPLVIILGTLGLIQAPGIGHEAPASLLLLIVLVAAFSYAVFQLTIPVAAVETGGSVHLMTRSWHLARGSYWRLLAFVCLLLVGLMIVLLFGQFALGSIITLALGRPDAFSLAALIISLVVAIIQATFTVIFAVMLARLYVQLAGGAAQPSVPSSGI